MNPDFDGIAPFYGMLEWLTAGRLLQRARTAFLAEAPARGRALLAGEGHGKLLAALRTARPELELTYLDASAEMARVARHRLGPDGSRGAPAVTWRVEDAFAAELPVSTFHLVSTPFFLDCFTPDQLARLVPKLSASATPDAAWLVTDFCLPERGWRRRRAEAVHWLMHVFFRAVTKLPARKWTEPAPFLKAAGWVRADERTFNHGLVRSQVWRRGPTD